MDISLDQNQSVSEHQIETGSQAGGDSSPSKDSSSEDQTTPKTYKGPAKKVDFIDIDLALIPMTASSQKSKDQASTEVADASEKAPKRAPTAYAIYTAENRSRVKVKTKDWEENCLSKSSLLLVEGEPRDHRCKRFDQEIKANLG
jgi:hypothetical protein